jgi:5'-3' exonuclease
VIVAPFEADAQLAYMRREGHIDAVYSEDMDFVIHQAGVFIFHWGFRSRGRDMGNIIQFEHVRSLWNPQYDPPPDHKWTVLDLVRKFGVRVLRAYVNLIGCDYIQSVPHLGSKTAITILSSCAAACEFAAPDILKAIQNLFDEEPCTRATDVARSFGVRAGGVESLLPRLLVRS